MPGAMSGHPFLYDMYIMNRILIIILLLTCTVSHAQPPETVQHLGRTDVRLVCVSVMSSPLNSPVSQMLPLSDMILRPYD